MDRIYFDLDTMLDTRLGTLARHSQELATKVFSGEYHQRDMDEFPGLSREEFMKLYAARNKDTLMSSVKTNIFALAHGVARQQVENNSMGGAVPDEITYVVNTYPYELSDEEKEQLRDVIEFCSLDTYPVEVIHVPDAYLTPQHCKEQYAMMVRYHWDYWIDMHAEAFKKVQMPGVTLIAPAMYIKRPDIDEMKAKGDMHPFKAVEIGLAPLITVRLMPVSMFSADDGIKGQPQPAL